MDVRRADQTDPIYEHGGTCVSYHMLPKGSMFEETKGTWLEFVGEFELRPGSHLEPHRHDTHEFYYLLHGTARMRIGAEERDVAPGDLIHIPPNAVHSIWPTEGASFRALAFAVSSQEPGVDATPASFD
jgi:quercetin dioxygenase-like cupin family protein